MKISFPDDKWSNFLPRVTKFDSYIALGMGLVRIDFGSNRLKVKVTGGHFVKVTGGHFEKSVITRVILKLDSPDFTHT